MEGVLTPSLTSLHQQKLRLEIENSKEADQVLKLKEERKGVLRNLTKAIAKFQ